MARFYGPVGYGESVEKKPGVWQDVITERNLFGDVLRNTRRLEGGEQVNNDITVSNSISVVADPYARDNFHAIRYIKWMGQYWTVTDVDASNPPRLILRLGEVYHGPKPRDPASVPSGSAG